jgi:hypothetical protein
MLLEKGIDDMDGWRDKEREGIDGLEERKGRNCILYHHALVSSNKYNIIIINHPTPSIHPSILLTSFSHPFSCTS